MNAVPRTLALLGALLLVAGIAAWPLSGAPGAWFASDPSMPDLNVSMWLPPHLLDALAGETGLWQADELLWPQGQRVQLRVWNLGVQLLQLPLYLFLEPIPAYNLSLVGLATLNGVGGYVLGRRLGGLPAGVAGAAVLLLSPYAWNELLQGRVEQGLLAGLALTVAALLAQQSDPGPRRAAVTGLLWAATGLCYWFYAYFLVFLFVPVGVVALLRRDGPRLRGLLVTAGVAAAAVAPFAGSLLWHAASEQSTYAVSTSPEVESLVHAMMGGASVVLDGMLWPVSRPALLRDALPLTALVATVLAFLGPLRRRVRWLLPLALGGLVLAMGPRLLWSADEAVLVGGMELQLPFAGLQAAAPGFRRLWWPYRWLSLFYVGAAGCVAALVAAVPRRARLPLALAVGGALLLELRVHQEGTRGGLVWDLPRPVAVPPVFAEIAAAPPNTAVLMLPYHGLSGSRLLWQAYLGQPTGAGLADTEDHLLDPAHVAFVASQPALRELRDLGRLPPASRRTPTRRDTSMVGELRALGFGYAVLWRGANPRAVYDALLGTPVFEDDTVIVWSLGAGAGARP